MSFLSTTKAQCGTDCIAGNGYFAGFIQARGAISAAGGMNSGQYFNGTNTANQAVTYNTATAILVPLTNVSAGVAYSTGACTLNAKGLYQFTATFKTTVDISTLNTTSGILEVSAQLNGSAATKYGYAQFKTGQYFTISGFVQGAVNDVLRVIVLDTFNNGGNVGFTIDGTGAYPTQLTVALISTLP